ncbi:hypothetical protein PENTCL1PPCAC_19414, partial [Pristionchus entomophagus]
VTYRSIVSRGTVVILVVSPGLLSGGLVIVVVVGRVGGSLVAATVVIVLSIVSSGTVVVLVVSPGLISGGIVIVVVFGRVGGSLVVAASVVIVLSIVCRGTVVVLIVSPGGQWGLSGVAVIRSIIIGVTVAIVSVVVGRARVSRSTIVVVVERRGRVGSVASPPLRLALCQGHRDVIGARQSLLCVVHRSSPRAFRRWVHHHHRWAAWLRACVRLRQRPRGPLQLAGGRCKHRVPPTRPRPPSACARGGPRSDARATCRARGGRRRRRRWPSEGRQRRRG